MPKGKKFTNTLPATSVTPELRELVGALSNYLGERSLAYVMRTALMQFFARMSPADRSKFFKNLTPEARAYLDRLQPD